LKPDYSQAACKGVDTHLFYPEVIGERGKKMKMKEPIKICAVCPIQMDCLIHACETGEFWGVWGGVSERRRKQLAESKEYYLWAARDCQICGQKFMPTVQTQFNCGPECFKVHSRATNRKNSAARRKSKASN
jgi:WhiB family redox-sensing transcriptional regulator